MTRAVPARLFGAGLPATGEPAELALGERELEARTASSAQRAAYTELRVRPVGTGRPGLELSWDSALGLRSVQVLSAPAVRLLWAHAPLAAAPAMRALRARHRRGALVRALGLSALGAVLLSPLLLLALFVSQADRAAQWVAQYVPIEQEARLGEQVWESLAVSLKLEDDGAQHAAVQELGALLASGSRFRFQFHVVRSDELNAFALPGGIIAVNSGLIEATTRPEELAGVLAHEIQHVEQRHSLQGLLQELGLRGLWLLATGDVGGGALAASSLQLISLGFSRDAESQADQAGFDTLVARGIDPSGMADFFDTLEERAGGSPPAFLSTHPASAARAAALRVRVSELAGAGRRYEPLPSDPWPPR